MQGFPDASEDPGLRKDGGAGTSVAGKWKCTLDFSTREFVGEVSSLGLRSWLLSEQNLGDLLDRGVK